MQVLSFFYRLILQKSLFIILYSINMYFVYNIYFFIYFRFSAYL